MEMCGCWQTSSCPHPRRQWTCSRHPRSSCQWLGWCPSVSSRSCGRWQGWHPVRMGATWSCPRTLPPPGCPPDRGNLSFYVAASSLYCRSILFFNTGENVDSYELCNHSQQTTWTVWSSACLCPSRRAWGKNSQMLTTLYRHILSFLFSIFLSLHFVDPPCSLLSNAPHQNSSSISSVHTLPCQIQTWSYHGQACPVFTPSPCSPIQSYMVHKARNLKCIILTNWPRRHTIL